MLTLLIVISLYLVAIEVGKRRERVTIGTYLIMLLIAVVQTAVVLNEMLTMEAPSP